MAMNVLSLFSGIGGLELGLERAGMTVVGQVEIDPYCRRVLAKHWPEVPRHDDVRTTVEWWLGTTPPNVADAEGDLRRTPRDERPTPSNGSSSSAASSTAAQPGDTRPTVDLVCGGFPCQPVSVAGQRLAQADPRWLWPAFHTVVRALRPRYVLVENVPGLLAAGMGDVLGDLAGIGYDAEWDRVPAAFVGAPHLRGRIFVVAYPNSRASDARRRRRGAAQAGPITHVADTDVDTGRPRRTGDTSQGAGGRDADRGGIRPHVADTDRGRQLQPGRGVSEIGRRTGDSGGSRDVANADDSGRDRWPGIFRPGRRGQPADGSRWPSESGLARVAHGIPRGMDRRRALGNAVVPQVAEHVGRLILAADRERGAA